MKKTSTITLLLAITVSTTLIGGCGKKADSTGASFTQAENDAGKEKEILRVQNDKSIPESVKPGVIESIRNQGKK